MCADATLHRTGEAAEFLLCPNVILLIAWWKKSYPVSELG